MLWSFTIIPHLNIYFLALTIIFSWILCIVHDKKPLELGHTFQVMSRICKILSKYEKYILSHLMRVMFTKAIEYDMFLVEISIWWSC